MNRITIQEAKERLRIPQLWRYFGFESKPGTSCRSPFREDRRASFSVSTDGKLWNDFGTGDAGDAVDFLQHATGLSCKAAFKKFLELVGANLGPALPIPHVSRIEPARPRPRFPEFRKGRSADFKRLASLRMISREGLEWASERGVLCFATLKDYPAWIVTDAARLNAQARRMDGQGWGHLPDCPKAYTLPGSWASWPIGIKEAETFPAIALVEGGPDFLAAHYIGLWQQATHFAKLNAQCSPVAMLGARQRIHEDALPLFAGKRVRIFGHADEAGHLATRCWAKQLATVDVKVDAFDFSGLEREDGKAAKDLNDCLVLNAGGFGQTERILP